MRNQIKKILKGMGKDVSWLCAETGLTFSAIYKIMRGDSIPRIQTAQKIAAALNLPIEKIWVSK